MTAHLVFSSLVLLTLACAPAAEAPKAASKPLYRDPVHDGAADVSIIWNRAQHNWFMFYTNRRANLQNSDGVTWVHNTKIGVAESSDHGTTWKYRGVADIRYGKPDYTYWAPELLFHAGTYHMFLTVVPGTFKDWNASREIVHLTSADLEHWQFVSKLNFSSDRVIDATVAQLPNGNWRLWYKDERDHTYIHYADSPDLNQWHAAGTAINDRSGEGPKVFRWKNQDWMITDVWKGLGVYRSNDLIHWTPQKENLLREPGTQPTYRSKGQHADIVVSGDRAYLFYFVHQGGPDLLSGKPESQRRTVIQVAELHEHNGELSIDRNKPASVDLQPPKP